MSGPSTLKPYSRRQTKCKIPILQAQSQSRTTPLPTTYPILVTAKVSWSLCLLNTWQSKGSRVASLPRLTTTQTMNLMTTTMKMTKTPTTNWSSTLALSLVTSLIRQTSVQVLMAMTTMSLAKPCLLTTTQAATTLAPPLHNRPCLLLRPTMMTMTATMLIKMQTLTTTMTPLQSFSPQLQMNKQHHHHKMIQMPTMMIQLNLILPIYKKK
mmetsp:Transcript_15253/g.22829  ORF Transcript_15253/g.22829 Transcript_15253/m.22829 type:complete len:211 (+) Transcript_15253:1415-2047(+)